MGGAHDLRFSDGKFFLLGRGFCWVTEEEHIRSTWQRWYCSNRCTNTRPFAKCGHQWNTPRSRSPLRGPVHNTTSSQVSYFISLQICFLSNRSHIHISGCFPNYKDGDTRAKNRAHCFVNTRFNCLNMFMAFLVTRISPLLVGSLLPGYKSIQKLRNCLHKNSPGWNCRSSLHSTAGPQKLHASATIIKSSKSVNLKIRCTSAIHGITDRNFTSQFSIQIPMLYR